MLADALRWRSAASYENNPNLGTRRMLLSEAKRMLDNCGTTPTGWGHNDRVAWPVLALCLNETRILARRRGGAEKGILFFSASLRLCAIHQDESRHQTCG